VDLGLYIDGYREILKFCSLLGSVFKFIHSEIESKCGVLEKLRENDKDGNYTTLKRMVKHEMESKLIFKPYEEYISGCRTIVRLQWGMDFIRTFLREVSKLNPEDGTSSMGKEAYYKTLGSHHTWILRQGAYLAMMCLPSKKNLVSTVCGANMYEEASIVLPLALMAVDEVYQRTDTWLKTNDLLSLP